MTAALPHVLVMMATYNGEDYLREQLDSILGQKGVRVSLRICDDCSTDSTPAICREYERDHANIHFTVNERNRGIAMNFMQMVYEAHEGDYDFFAFSDQDDVWLPEKLQVAVAAICDREADASSRSFPDIGTPVLYCSDVLDVDERLENGVRELATYPPKVEKRATVLLRSFYAGCTMVFNRDFMRLVQLHQYEEMKRIHDTFIAAVGLYCANFVIDLDHALILRRLTGRNNGGPIAAGLDVHNASVKRAFSKPNGMFREMATRLYGDYGSYMSDADRDMVESFLHCRDSLVRRIHWALSPSYFAVSRRDTLLIRLKLLLGRY